MKHVRVRFAPSPTGEPHIGSLWTALFNWVFAKQHNGEFVLRIEDTDQKRLVPGTQERILEALDWLGLTPDEGPVQGGAYAPYIQSQRLKLYQEHARMLVERGAAYRCFCTSERLDELRQSQTAQKLPPKYDKHCAQITKAEAQQRMTAGETAVIRMNLPGQGTIEVDDVIRGKVSFQYGLLDDSVILKSDGFPTYHLANVVDDHAMDISHVIRAEEWLPSTPKHLFLYQAFEWTPPVFAHLPLLLGRDRSKLSKRHGATAALAYRDQGYLPEAMLNFLGLMGWHPKGEKETLSLKDFIKHFRVEAVHPAGAVFDQTKLDWLNGLYIRQLSPADLLTRLKQFWQIDPAFHHDRAWLEKALILVQDRLTKLSEINELINFVFPSEWNNQLETLAVDVIVPKKATLASSVEQLRWVKEYISKHAIGWSAAELKIGILQQIKDTGRTNLAVLWPLRATLSLRAASPDVFDMMELLGPAEVTRRIDQMVAKATT